MSRFPLVILFLFSCLGFLYCQEIRPIEDFQFELDDYPYTIGEVSYVNSKADCFGVENRKGTKEWTPLYFEQILGSSLSELLHNSIRTRIGADTIHVRFNRFFISQNASISEPRKCTFEVQMDIIRKNDTAAYDVFSFGTSETCHIKMTHGIIHDDLISTTLRRIFSEFKKVDSPGAVEMLLARTEAGNLENSKSLPPFATENIRTVGRSSNGIYWSYADYLNGRLDSTYKVSIKKEVDSTYSKIKVEEFYTPKDYWGYQIDGGTFYNFDGHGLKLSKKDDGLYTKIYPESSGAEIGDALIISAGYLFGGILGQAIAFQSIAKSRAWRNNNNELGIDPLTGCLELKDSDKRDGLKNSIVLYHTQFSKVNSILVRSMNAQVEIPQKSYAEIEIPISREGGFLILDDGLSQDTLHFKNIDRTADRFLIKSRKGEVSAQFLSTRDFEALPKEEVQVEYVE